MTHKHGNIQFEGTKIIFYIESTKTLQVGDKLSNRYGAKGILSHIVAEDKTCYGEYTKKVSGRDIEIYLPAPAVLGRKNLAITENVALYGDV